MIGATVVADSLSPAGVRLTTLDVTMHRFVLAEFNTHRVFSRNSASSRAIPLWKRTAAVLDDPALPIEVGREQKGMQAGELIEGDDLVAVEQAIRWGAKQMVALADELASYGVHKQTAARYLEPFLMHRVLISSTEWDGFFEQRMGPKPQPEMRLVAEAMLDALTTSTPVQFEPGQWHLPLVTAEEAAELGVVNAQRVAVARCARISYLTHDRRDAGADLALWDRLLEGGHWSPFEHVATPANEFARPAGNFRGWHQLRHHHDRRII